MIRHIVLIKFRPDITDDVKASVFAELEQLKNKIPDIREWSVGWQIKKSEKNYDIAEVGTFDDAAALERFRLHPAHIKARDYTGTVGDWTTVDYEY